jgi:flagellar motor protein MotB
MGLSAVVLLSMFSAGCQNKLYDENKKLYDENKALRAQNDQMRTPPQPVVQQTAPPPPVVTNPSPATQPQAVAPAPNPPEQIGGLETEVNPEKGTTTVRLPSDVFFDPGQATLKQSAKASLDKVVVALKKQFAGKRVEVDGHTDSQPIRVSKWNSNQELSEARAKAVRDYLVSHGIDASRLSIRGLGDTRPRGTDMAKNRRVEIVVMTGR